VEEGAELVLLILVLLILMEKTVEVEEVLAKTQIQLEATEGMEHLVKVIKVQMKPVDQVEVVELLLLRQPLMAAMVYL
jgi:hypothetical protein